MTVTDSFERLKAALADRYVIEVHGNNAIWATTGKGFDEIPRRT